MSDYLTTLPIEIIHQILDHIPTLESLSSLCLVNKHLRSASLAHLRLQPDFSCVTQSIDKKQFDGFCTQLLRSTAQIVSLILFDKDDPMTPIKNALFFSRFTCTDIAFSNLRSLTLTCINYDTWCQFRLRLSSKIVTLSIQLVHVGPRASSSMTSAILTETLLFSPSLERLSIKMSNYSNGMISIHSESLTTASSLRYFRSEAIAIDLSSLFDLTPALRTVEIICQNENLKFYQIHFRPLYLQRLRIEVHTISWTGVAALLSTFPRLNHLIVIVNDSKSRMADGLVWASLLREVQHFEMKLLFGPNMFSTQSIDLDSFRTRFWLEEKKWFVTYSRNSRNRNSILYTNPSPANDCSTQMMVGILPSESITYPSLHCMPIKYYYLTQALLHRYAHITELDLLNNTTIFPGTFKDLINYLNTLNITARNVSFQWVKKPRYELTEFLCSIPCLCALSVSVSALQYLYSYQWSHIIHLNIENDLINGYQLSFPHEIERLRHSFPCLERLDIHSTSTTLLPQLLKRMKKTLIDVIIRQPLSVSKEQFITREWIEQNVELEQFHYACDRMNSVTLWLSL